MEHFTPSEAPIHETQRLPVLPPRQILGRNRELGQAYAQIRAGMPVLFHGSPGMGTTALAAMIATAYTTFEGGVLWWSVPGDNLPNLIVRLGRAYGVREITTSADPLEHIGAAAELLQREHQPLIVLDNIQDFDAARDFVRKVAGGIPLIMTSNVGASGPWIPFELGPLGQADSLTLLMQAANRKPDVASADMQAISESLGGNPLELMLAGRHLAATEQTPAEFRAALSHVASEARASVLPVIFRELPDALKGILLNLGATFTGSASAALLGYLQLSPGETISRVMDMLLARGLVQDVPCPDADRCFAVHEQVHHFTQVWLRNSQRLDASQARVHEALLAYVEQHHDDTREARNALVAEMPNLLRLAQYAAKQRDTMSIQRLSAVLHAVFDLSGAYGFEIDNLDELVITLNGSDAGDDVASGQLDLFAGSDVVAEPDPGPVEELLPPATVEQPFEQPVIAAPEAAAQVAEPRQDVDDLLADFVDDGIEGIPEAEDLIEDLAPDALSDYAEELFSEPPVEAAQEEFEPERSAVEFMRPEEGDTDLPKMDDEEPVEVGLALEDLLKASRDARQSGDRGRLASALLMLGRAWMQRGQHEQAGAAYNEALVLCEDSQDQAGMLAALEAMAGINLETGNLEEAVLFATRAENLANEAGDPVQLGHVLALLGDIRLELGQLDEALNTYVDAIEALQAGDDEISLGVVQAKLGATHMDRGEFTRAVTMLSSAQGIFADAGLMEYEGRVLGNLGTAYGNLGQWPDAEANHREALEIARHLDDPEEQERQLANLGYAAQAQGDWQATQEYYRAALDLAYQASNQEWTLRYLDVLGRMLMDNVAQVELAVSLLEEAEQIVPDPERDRLLRRASKRLLRLEQSGIAQEPTPPSIEEWAAGASV